MVDLAWLSGIPGLVAGAWAVGYSAATRRRLLEPAKHADALRQQEAHRLMLWPRAWEGGRPLSQVEQVIEENRDWLGYPLDPEEQRRQMMAESERLIELWKLKGGGDAG